MAIPTSREGLEFKKFKESTVTANQPGIVVVNPDGSNVGASVTVTADTEFPAAAALGANTANPTTTLVGSCTMAFDGTAWDPVTNGAGVAATALRTTLGSDDPAVVSLQLLDDTVFTDDAVFTPATSKGLMMMAQADETAPDSVDEGDAGALRMTLTRFLKVSLGDLISGEDQTNNLLGFLPKPVAASTYTGTTTQNNSFQAALIKGGAGIVRHFSVINTTAGALYFQLHNDVDGTIAGGATALYKYLVPASSQIVIGPGEIGDAGLYFSTGISIAASSAAATYTAAVAGDLLVDINYV